MTQPPAPRYYRPPSRRWMAPNRFDSACVRCTQMVAAGTGEFRFDGVRWIVRHSGGRCHTPEYTQYVSMESPGWQRIRQARLEYARGRCEWRTFLVIRCSVTSSLECHHRHYQTLGHEPLKDLIILCKKHHAIADSRRRSWGTWPLFGTPFGSTGTGNASLIPVESKVGPTPPQTP